MTANVCLSRPHAHRQPRRVALAAGLVSGLMLMAACGSGDESEPPTPTVNPDLPAPTALTDQSQVVPAGEWGVVKVAESAGSPDSDVVAIKISDVTVGEPGQLSDVTSVTGSSELIKTGTPHWITIHWAALTGAGWNSPIQRIWGWNAAADASASQLSLPASVEECAEPSTTQIGGLNVENVDCAVAMFEDASLNVDQVRYVDRTTYPDGDNAIRFAVPTG